MKVVRACMGGTWGQENSIPAPVSAGSSAKYTFEMAKNSAWNIANIKLVGLVQTYTANSREILNVVMGQKVTSSTVVTSTGDPLFVKAIGENGELSINIKNNGTSAKEYTLSLAKTPGTTWNASIEPNEYVFSVPASQTYNVKLNLNVGSTGSGEANLNIQETDGMTFTRSIKGYSNDIDLMHVNLDPLGDAAGLGNLIKSYPEYSRLQTVPYADFTQIYGLLPNLKLAIYNTGDGGML